MDRAEDKDFYWIVSGAGTFHIARKSPTGKPKFWGKYVSLCWNVSKKDDSLEDPMEFDSLDDVPDGREICGCCKKRFVEDYRNVSVYVHMDKGIALDIKRYFDGEDLSEDRLDDIQDELEKRI